MCEQVNTERYRETVRKEEKIVAGRSESMARMSLESLTERRRESAGAKADALDKMVADRRYKPTSQALTIGTKLEMASSCNPQNYLPPIQLQDGGVMPAAYRCPHAHSALPHCIERFHLARSLRPTSMRREVSAY